MKKISFKKIAVLMLALSLLTACFVGSTFAKYTSTVSANDSVTVAKWEIEVNNNEITVETPSITFDLFNTIYDTFDGNEETDVKTGMIAPGTQGSFALTIENLSDVNAAYTIDFEETANTLSVPILYSTKNPEDDDFDASADWKELADLSVEDQPIAMTTGSATVTVYWMWDFEGDDTSIGIAAQTATTVEVKATITVEQVD